MRLLCVIISKRIFCGIREPSEWIFDLSDCVISIGIELNYLFLNLMIYWTIIISINLGRGILTYYGIELGYWCCNCLLIRQIDLIQKVKQVSTIMEN